LHSFWKEGLLSTGQSITCRSVACVAFTELNVAAYPTIRVVNDFAEFGGGLYRYYPHVATNAEGNKTMVFSASNKTQFVDVRFVGIPSSSTCKNCLDGPDTVIQPGATRYVRLDGDKKNRWGDYSGASADTDGIGIWVHGEFAAATANRWATQVALTRESGAKMAADLVPVPISTPPGGFCNFSQGSLIVTVRNRGNVDASPSFTQIDFSNGSSFSLPTPNIAVNNSIDLAPLTIPSTCFMPDCSFRITVDSTNLMDELDEANNTVNGQCVG
jgi:CARDB